MSVSRPGHPAARTIQRIGLSVAMALAVGLLVVLGDCALDSEESTTREWDQAPGRVTCGG